MNPDSPDPRTSPGSAPALRPIVVGTAGHIDHGKTALVRELTGIDTDRLPEEKERGISIDLGFAHLQPRPGLQISFVDVPGHERFVKNMLAGATGIDAVLFIVAADEGLMPQSREHFDIVRLLGIERILPVITKVDLADRETIDIVRLELEDYLGKALGRVPQLFEVSARARVGLDELKEALVRLAEDLPERPAAGAPRLPVDRRFILQGHGTVVTGTQVSGTFATGDAVEILPSGAKARIRELQSHGEKAETTGPGQRVAIKLHGVGLEEIARGDVISTPGALLSGYILNAHVQLLADSPMPIARRTRLRVHIGSAELLARAEPLEAETLEPGQSGFVQLRLESPTAAVGGQKLVLRRYSPALTIGGGSVVEFPAPKESSVHGAALEVLERLASGRPEAIAVAMTMRAGQEGLPTAELRAELHRRGLPLPALQRGSGLYEMAGGLLQLQPIYEEHRRAVLEQLAAYHAANPLEVGARPERLRGGPLSALSASAHQTLLATLVRDRQAVSDQDRYRLPNFAPILDEASRGQLDALVEDLERRGLVEESAFLPELQKIGARPKALLQYLQEQGSVLRMEGEVLLGPRFLARTLAGLRADLTAPAGLGVAQLREKTGWSRKYCIPFLELTDSLQLTRRRGDVRVSGPQLAPFLEKHGATN